MPTRASDFFKLVILLFCLCGILYTLYSFFTPIGFFILTGIVLSIIYFLVTQGNRSRRSSFIVGKNKLTYAAKLSGVIFVLLFILSILVLQSYQRPTGEKPYFSNIDHYAIQNTGIGFGQSLVLYSPDSDNKGLWKSDDGIVEVKIRNRVPELYINNFFTPLFRIDSNAGNNSELLNPVWKSPISNGFSIRNAKTSLTWKNFVSEGSDNFSMDIIFSTSDELLLDENTHKYFSDTFHIDAKIKKGISLFDLFQTTDRISKESDQDFSSANKDKSSFLINGVVYQWLNSIGQLEIIAANLHESNKKSLYLQPSLKAIEQKFECYNQSILVPFSTTHKISINKSDKFYVGLGKSRYPFQITENTLNQPKPYLLSFSGEQNLIPFFYVPGNELTRGQKVIRFIKNGPDLADTSLQLNEGFVFQKRMKNNDDTRVKGGLIEIETDLSGTPLKWRNSFDEYKFGPGQFSLKSLSNDLMWYYQIRDLSDNWYKFDVVKYFLFIIILMMIIVVFYFPSSKSYLIETPLFIFIYCFLVFRYLLAWRIATFPPLENIKKHELEETLQRFDFIPSIPIPISFSFIFICAFLFILMIKRKLEIIPPFVQKSTGNKITSSSSNDLKKFLINFKFNYKYRWAIAYSLFLLICILFLAFGGERIATIILPLFGYFFFAYKALQSSVGIEYEQLTSNKSTLNNKFNLFSSSLFQTEITIINLLGFLYFAIFDRGFAVFFLIFILIRFIFFTLAQSKSLRIYNGRQFNWTIIAAFFVAIILGVLLFYKGSIYFALKYVTYFLALGFIFTSFIIYGLRISKRVKLFSCILFIISAIVLVIPITSQKINQEIQKRIKNTKFRSELIYKPLEEVLLENEFQSSQESKIIETAQNQWFIHSYLKDARFLNPLKNSETIINFRPHFRTGVDYTTQTRDVVLPRYVIGEFGGFTMLVLLFFCTIPLILFLSGYRIFDKRFVADSSISLMSLLFLFTIALMLWLTSTNRFVFFGQDFPFMSITSKISVLLPVGLVFIVLLSAPEELRLIDSRRAKNRAIIAFSILFIFLVFLLSNQSTLISDEKFHVNFSKVEKNTNSSINKILGEIQDQMGKLPLLIDEELSTEEWLPEIKKIINALSDNKEFIKLKDSLTLYEKGIWEKIQANPTLGLTVNSPVHFKVQNGRLSCQFNNYWTMELPPYNEQKVWKGSIVQDIFTGKNKTGPYLKNYEGIKLLRIPSEFSEKNEPLAILDVQGSANFVAYIYNLKTKRISEVRPQSDAKLIDSNQIVLWQDGMNVLRSFNVSGNSDKYFAKNILLNGKQQFIYPLGSKLFWARHWALAVKKQNEKGDMQSLSSDLKITLDYDLTDNIGTFLENDFKTVLKNKIPTINDPSFSVMVADGDGNIRVMNDFALQRQIIDPNNEQRIVEEQQHDYFYINTARERMQWGNINLLRMKLGPASSFKPLMAAAIASQANAGWEELQLLPANNPALDFKAGIDYYASEKISPSWKYLGSDNTKSPTFQQYIFQSNNIYNSVMIFLGSHTKDQIIKAGGKIQGLMKPIKGPGPLTFPYIKIGTQNYELRDRSFWPRSSDSYSYFGHEKSLLSLGLKQCIGLSTDVDNGLSIAEKKYSISVINDSSTWGVPEASYMLLTKRIDANWQDNFNKAIRNTSLGSAGIFEVTPLSMIEMYGRLVTMNAGYKVTIDKPRITSADWLPASDWRGGYETFHYNYLINAMSKTIKVGTATNLSKWANSNQGYYFYAKTGTGGSDDASSKDKNSKRLALIISKYDLSEKKNSNKFITVYFTFDNARTDDNKNEEWIYQQVYIPILDKIIRSTSFKKYME